MQKLLITVKFANSEQARDLIQAFFLCFNPNNRIETKGKEGKLEIVFNDKPPLKIIKAVTGCEKFNLSMLGEEQDIKEDFALANEESFDSANEECKEISEVAEQEAKESFDSANEESEEISKVAEPKAKESFDSANEESKEISEVDGQETKESFEELAQKADSLENFIQAVTEKMGLSTSSKKEVFRNLIIFSVKYPEEIKWSKIEQKVLFSQSDRVYVGNMIKEHFGLKFLEFLKRVSKLCEGFKSDAEKAFDARKTEKRELGIPLTFKVEETLKRLKSYRTEVRVLKILEAMGLRDKSVEEKETVYQLILKGVETRAKEYSDIEVSPGVTLQDDLTSRMILAKFINEYVQENNGEKITVMDFIKSITEVVTD